MTLSTRKDLSGRNCTIWECTTQTRQECLAKNLFGDPETSPVFGNPLFPGQATCVFCWTCRRMSSLECSLNSSQNS